MDNTVEVLELRPSVLAFAQAMEQKLRDNDHKGDWGNLAPSFLLRRTNEKLNDLLVAVASTLGGDGQVENVLREATNVANFAMMVAEVVQATDPAEYRAHACRTAEARHQPRPAEVNS